MATTVGSIPTSNGLGDRNGGLLEGAKSVAIIGYTGLVGSYISQSIARRIQQSSQSSSEAKPEMQSTNSEIVVDLYNSKNSFDIAGKSYDVLICAGIYAVKWWANQNPKEDKEQIATVIKNVIKKVGKIHKRVICISTIDCYNHLCGEGGDEDMECRTDWQEAYGNNRREFELVVAKTFDCDLHIVRLSGLYGYGLKKNVIYDFIWTRLKFLDPSCSFQWYDLAWLMSDLDRLVSRKIGKQERNVYLVNLVPEPLHNKDLLDLFKKVRPVEAAALEDRTTEFFKTKDFANKKYLVRTKHWQAWDCAKEGFIYTTNDVRDSLYAYMCQMCHGNIVASHLSIKDSRMQNPSSSSGDSQVLPEQPNDGCPARQTIQQMFGVSKLEISPFKHFGENFDQKIPLNLHTASQVEVNEFVNFFAPFKKDNIYSFQALHFPHGNWNLFNPDESSTGFETILAYTKKLTNVAAYLGTTVLVFGSPRLRSPPGRDPTEEDWKRAAVFFKELSAHMTSLKASESIGNLRTKYGICQKPADEDRLQNLRVCLEPNAREYGCTLCIDSVQTYEFLHERVGLDQSNVRMMLDIGCMLMEQEDVADVVVKHVKKSLEGYHLGHIHFSAPKLVPLSSKFGLNYHDLLKAIYEAGYTGSVTIEALNCELSGLVSSLWEVTVRE